MRRLFRAFRAFDLTPLGHPVWWGALALLLINDNLFKGHGVVPGWLAGKLSDFAFLIVAPTLFATLIPRRVPGRRTFATAAVVAVYVAADLSRGASDAVIAVAARVGLHWRLWPDPTDLLALAVLPITVWLLRRTPRPDADSATARRARVQRERAGVVLGAIACLATSSLPGYPHNAFLFNRTAANADVRITWVSPPMLRIPAEFRYADEIETTDLTSVIRDADVLYVTRVQKERITETLGDCHYGVTVQHMAMAKPTMTLLHPLPRVYELPPELDDDPRAAYFRQMRYGLFMRMGILAKVLDA